MSACYNSLTTKEYSLYGFFFLLENHFSFKVLFLFRKDENFVLTLINFSCRREPNLPILIMEMSFVEKVKCHKEST